jgi:hypothetical protein
MAQPFVISGDAVAHFIDVGIHFLEVGCIAIATWLIHVGRREVRQFVRGVAVSAANEAIAPTEHKVDSLANAFSKHEDLDENRHIEVLTAIGQRQRA